MTPADLGALVGFVGTWQGDGEGHYPTIEPFAYHESVTFAGGAKPFLAYGQATRRAGTDEPLHAESGYLRPAGPRRVELLVAQPTGIVEVYEGGFHDGILDLQATTVGLAATAKRVRAVRRRFVLDGDILTYDLWMAHGDVPLSHHLHAVLRRGGGG